VHGGRKLPRERRSGTHGGAERERGIKTEEGREKRKLQGEVRGGGCSGPR